MYYNIWTNLASAVKLLKPHRYKRKFPLLYTSEHVVHSVNATHDWFASANQGTVDIFTGINIFW